MNDTLLRQLLNSSPTVINYTQGVTEQFKPIDICFCFNNVNEIEAFWIQSLKIKRGDILFAEGAFFKVGLIRIKEEKRFGRAFRITVLDAVEYLDEQKNS